MWTAAVGCLGIDLAFLLILPVLSRSDSTVVVPTESDPAWWAGVALLTVQSAALLWRLSSPPAVLVAVAVVAPIGALGGLADLTSAASVAVLFAAYTVASRLSLTAAWPALLTGGLLVTAGQTISRLRLHVQAPAAVGNAVLQAAGIIVPALLVGVFVAARRAARQAEEDQLLAVAGERAARLQAVVSNERMAMARELHDIAAHHLTGIAVMTAAIGPQIDTDPEAAKQAVALVRQQSRTLLRDLRSLVGLLRDQTPIDGAARASREQTLDSISELVADATATGLPIEFTVLRTADPLGTGVGPLAQLAAYRIVGEAIANAARHAPGARCRVVLDDRGADTLTISVTNDRPPAGPAPEPRGGFGLIGMRERAELTGARLDYGPTAEGGWQVTLMIPRGSDFTAPADRPDTSEQPA